MPWSYQYNPTLEVVEVVCEGRVASQDLREATSELIALEREKGVSRFLVDATDMELASRLTDIYNLPAKQYVDEDANRQARVAVVLPVSPESRQAVEFYETACTNRGWMVRAFDQRQEAVDWLTEGPEEDAR